MDIDTSVLRNFLLLCKTLNFTRASEQTHIAQPALSRQIKQLEDLIGAVLFNRNKRNVELTSAGKYFQKEAEHILLTSLILLFAGQTNFITVRPVKSRLVILIRHCSTFCLK